MRNSTAEFWMHFLFHDKDSIAKIMHPKHQSVYYSAYRWIGNTKPSLEVVRLVNLVSQGFISHSYQSHQSILVARYEPFFIGYLLIKYL